MRACSQPPLTTALAAGFPATGPSDGRLYARGHEDRRPCHSRLDARTPGPSARRAPRRAAGHARPGLEKIGWAAAHALGDDAGPRRVDAHEKVTAAIDVAGMHDLPPYVYGDAAARRMGHRPVRLPDFAGTRSACGRGRTHGGHGPDRRPELGAAGTGDPPERVRADRRMTPGVDAVNDTGPMTSDDHRRDRPARAPSRRALTAWRSAARPPSSGSARGRRTTGTNATHACIGRMYASEPGSARHHDAVAPGLARPADRGT